MLTRDHASAVSSHVGGGGVGGHHVGVPNLALVEGEADGCAVGGHSAVVEHIAAGVGAAGQGADAGIALDGGRQHTVSLQTWPQCQQGAGCHSWGHSMKLTPPA